MSDESRTKELPVVRESPRIPTQEIWNTIQAIAPTMHMAACFGVGSPEQAAAIMLKGYELGLSLSGSFEFIHIIEGRPALSPRGALALIIASPLCAGVKIDDLKDDKGNPTGCRVWMKRSNGFEYTVKWSVEDAKQAGVVKPSSGWEKYPANMLRWRAVGFCADVVFPDVIGGMKRADDLGADLTPNGEIIEGSWQTWPAESVPESEDASPEETATSKPADAQSEPEQDIPTLQTLAEKYGAEAIMAANDGRIPATDEELTAVAQALEGDHDQ